MLVDIIVLIVAAFLGVRSNSHPSRACSGMCFICEFKFFNKRHFHAPTFMECLIVYFLVVFFRCDDVCLRHGYSVRYTGVGDPPSDLSHLGCCSQAAIFTETSGKPGERTDEEVHKLVRFMAFFCRLGNTVK